MVDSSLIVTVIVLFALNFLYNFYVDASKDVNEAYLNQQSIVDATKKPGESAIYKSNKLDHPTGLRVGLDIRYDHYKLRNGNFCDLWELLVNGNKREKHEITVNGRSMGVFDINGRVCKFSQYLQDNKVKKLGISGELFMKNLDVFIVLVACLITQTTVCFYSDKPIFDDIDLHIISKEQESRFLSEKVLFVESRVQNSISLVVSEAKEIAYFTNEYSSQKDRGIALEFVTRVGPKMLKRVIFTQANLVSGIASTIKHLPLSEVLSNNDKFLCVLSKPSSEEILANFVKIIACFVTNTHINITDDSSWHNIQQYKPTVVSIHERELSKELPVGSLTSSLGMFMTFKFKQSLKLLSRGKFFTTNNTSLRLMYIHKLITDKPTLNSFQLNEYRSLLGARIISEFGYPNLAGPVVLTDFYDYRVFEPKKDLLSYGCIFQSLEIKLVGEKNNEGTIYIRGYNIGKVISYSNDGTPINSQSLQNEGFMPLENVKGVWGNDGCLYVYRC